MKKFWTLPIVIAVFATFTLSACKEQPVGSKARPFTMYFIPSVDAETISTTADAMIEFVSKKVSQKLYGKETGFYIKSSIPTSYVSVVEAFGTGKADFAALTTFSYILTKDIKKYDVDVIFNVIRGEGETHYKSQILTRADSGIKKIEDLKGKKFAFTDPASTSGYILPNQLFRDRGIELGQTVFAQKHSNVVTMIYQGQVDAGATYYSPPIQKEVSGKKVRVLRDARVRVKTQFPDVEEKIKIIGFSMDTPNDPWVIRSRLSEDPSRDKAIREAISEAVYEFAQTETGRKTLEESYTITGLAKANDAMYNDIRKVIISSGLDIERTLAGK